MEVFIYFALVAAVTLLVLGSTALFTSKKGDPVKFQPYESGIQTKTNLFQERFLLRHYLVGLIFLVLDIEVVFLYPWAVVAKKMGIFAYYEMLFFLIVLLVGFIYVWRKKGLEWD